MKPILAICKRIGQYFTNKAENKPFNIFTIKKIYLVPPIKFSKLFRPSKKKLHLSKKI